MAGISGANVVISLMCGLLGCCELVPGWSPERVFFIQKIKLNLVFLYIRPVKGMQPALEGMRFAPKEGTASLIFLYIERMCPMTRFTVLEDGRELSQSEVSVMFPPRPCHFNTLLEAMMKKTPGASKAGANYGYCKHLRKQGKRLANKASRKVGQVKLN